MCQDDGAAALRTALEAPHLLLWPLDAVIEAVRHARLSADTCGHLRTPPHACLQMQVPICRQSLALTTTMASHDQAKGRGAKRAAPATAPVPQTVVDPTEDPSRTRSRLSHPSCAAVPGGSPGADSAERKTAAGGAPREGSWPDRSSAASDPQGAQAEEGQGGRAAASEPKQQRPTGGSGKWAAGAKEEVDDREGDRDFVDPMSVMQ